MCLLCLSMEHPSVIQKAWCHIQGEYEAAMCKSSTLGKRVELSPDLWVTKGSHRFLSLRKTAEETNPVEVPVHDMLNFFLHLHVAG